MSPQSRPQRGRIFVAKAPITFLDPARGRIEPCFEKFMGIQPLAVGCFPLPVNLRSNFGMEMRYPGGYSDNPVGVLGNADRVFSRRGLGHAKTKPALPLGFLGKAAEAAEHVGPTMPGGPLTQAEGYPDRLLRVKGDALKGEAQAVALVGEASKAASRDDQQKLVFAQPVRMVMRPKKGLHVPPQVSQ